MAKLSLIEKTELYNSFVKNNQLLNVYPVVEKFKTHKTADERLDEAQAFHMQVLASTKESEAKMQEAKEEMQPKAKKVEVLEKPEIIAYELPIIEDDNAEPKSQTAQLIDTVVRAADLDDKEWYRTGAWILANRDRFATDAKGNREVSYVILDAGADESGAVPESDFNNSGKYIKLRKKDGSVKWSAWSKTRKFTQNLADIFKAIEVSGWDACFPDGELTTRPDILELKKVAGGGETPLQTLARSIDMAVKKLDQIETADKDAVKLAIDQLQEAYKVWIA